MCGVGNRTCGICANAGFCLAGMNDDYFSPATTEQVEKRLKENKYPADREIMLKYLNRKKEQIQDR